MEYLGYLNLELAEHVTCSAYQLYHIIEVSALKSV